MEDNLKPHEEARQVREVEARYKVASETLQANRLQVGYFKVAVKYLEEHAKKEVGYFKEEHAVKAVLQSCEEAYGWSCTYQEKESVQGELQEKAHWKDLRLRASWKNNEPPGAQKALKETSIYP